MNHYKELYYELFNGITDTMENLKKLQLDAEQKYMQSHEQNFHWSYLIKPKATSAAHKKEYARKASK